MRFKSDVNDNGLLIAMSMPKIRRNMKIFDTPNHLDKDKNVHVSVFRGCAIVTLQMEEAIQFCVTPRTNLDTASTSHLFGKELINLLRDIQKQVKQLAKGVKGEDLPAFLQEYNLG